MEMMQCFCSATWKKFMYFNVIRCLCPWVVCKNRGPSLEEVICMRRFPGCMTGIFIASTDPDSRANNQYYFLDDVPGKKQSRNIC